MSMYEFSGKVVILTGVSSGLGHDIAMTLSARGARLVLTGADRQKVVETAIRCADVSPGGRRPLVVSCDFAYVHDMQKLVHITVGEFGRIDMIINHGVVWKRDTDINDQPDPVLAARALYILTKEAAPWLLASNGLLMNVTSVSGHHDGHCVLHHSDCSVCNPSGIPAGTAKTAIDMMIKIISSELKSKAFALSPRSTPEPDSEPAPDLFFEDYRSDHQYFGNKGLYNLSRRGEVSNVSNTATVSWTVFKPIHY